MSEDKMKTEIETLGEVFTNQEQWTVPVYQRHYVWKSEEDDQIPGMWDDWKSQATKILNGKPLRPHYFGAIIYSYKRASRGKFLRNDLVDGQQRLTTFQLAFAALRDTSRIFDYGKTKEIGKYLLNKFDEEPEREDDRYKLLPSKHDVAVFKEIVSIHENDPTKKSHLTKAYDCFCEKIHEFIDERKTEKETEELIDALKDALLNHFHVVTIQLGNHDDAQQIFGSLNGKGQPLSPFDLVRNDIFLRAFKEHGEIKESFEREWGYFEEPFWSKEVGRARLKKARADHFIADAVVAENAKEVNQHRIATEYKNYAETSPLDSFEQLELLKKYGDSYKALQKPKGEATDGIAKMLRQWDLSTMNPLVMWIDARTSLPDDKKVKLFSMIESYIIRREICHLSTKNFNKAVPIILGKMRNQKDNIIEVFKEFLEDASYPSTRMPTDKEVSLACEENRIYKNMNAPKLTYILKCIEESTSDDFVEEVIINTKKLNIEHIMPQSWHEHWPLKGFGEISPEADSELVRERENLIHTIGNLTLVTSKFNSSIKNSSWQDKKAKIEKKSRLGFNLDIVKEPEWNEDKIKERSVKLANKINKIWKHPSSE